MRILRTSPKMLFQRVDMQPSDHRPIAAPVSSHALTNQVACIHCLSCLPWGPDCECNLSLTQAKPCLQHRSCKDVVHICAVNASVLEHLQADSSKKPTVAKVLGTGLRICLTCVSKQTRFGHLGCNDNAQAWTRQRRLHSVSMCCG